MTSAQADEPDLQKPLRLWPGAVIVALQWLVRFVVPAVVPDTDFFGAIGAILGALAIVVWWAFFSRAPGPERWGAVAVMIVALAATPYVLHESLATAAMGIGFYIYAVPVLCLALVVWAAATRRLAAGPRRAAMVATILVSCGAWALVRTGGASFGGSEFAWRWSRTPEERLLARGDDDPAAPLAAVVTETVAEWPGFRGPRRDGVVPGVRIETDWSASPPVELWRREIGPGWSSFAVSGDLLYTQEQRGDDEVVSCYRASTGEPVWRHRDPARFWESNAGAGPRATPALSGGPAGRVYTLGATGILNALDAGSGAVAWSRDAAADAGVAVPYWGFSGSPLVAADAVVVAVDGKLAAYDLDTGDPRWLGPDGGRSYSSPHMMTIDGVVQILLLAESGARSLAPADGAVLWEHAWPGAGILQPAMTAGGDVLISALGVSRGKGLRRLAVARDASPAEPDGWTTEEHWTSTGLKPYFNDFVVHDGHAYGFDGRILACIELEDGERRWKGGRYGNGQLLALPEQDLLLVVSERGELALVGATPETFAEHARFAAIEGKTWNHPALVGDLLLVRNDREMAAFRLPLADGRDDREERP